MLMMMGFGVRMHCLLAYAPGSRTPLGAIGVVLLPSFAALDWQDWEAGGKQKRV